MTMTEELSLNIVVPEIKKKETKPKEVEQPSRSDSFKSKKNLGRKQTPAVVSSSTVTEQKSRTKDHTEKHTGPNDTKKTKSSSLFTGCTAPEGPKNEFEVVPMEETLFSEKTFKNYNAIHPHLVGNLEQLFGITTMTMVQQLTIPVLLSGKDALVRSQTGSGKTLAYALPIMQTLQAVEPKLTRNDGVRALVVLPTRELALQTYECFQKLMRAFTWIVPGILVGGEKRKSEKARLRKGITVLIGTPGRILDHCNNTKTLHLHNVDWLILDEADLLLNMGYEKDVSSIIEAVNRQREESTVRGRKQTVLLSATLTTAVERLAGLTLNDPSHVDACEETMSSEDALIIPQSLKQNYIVVPAKLRLVTLSAVIIQNCKFGSKHKLLVFIGTQEMVDYYCEIIPTVISSSVSFFKLHGDMTQADRCEVFKEFRAADSGVLLCTDVAARGLDLPKVDWIVQFTAPTSPSEYVHRVGRTARVGSDGSALIFLEPSELGFITWLNDKRIKLEEVNIETYLKCLMKINLETKDGQRWGGGIEGAATVLQQNFEQAVLDQKGLHLKAVNAYKSWVRFYASFPKASRTVFCFKNLHLGHHAKCFALRDPPTAIGGIGKPVSLKNKGPSKTRKPVKRKIEPLKLVSAAQEKRLLISEFDSGLPSSKKRKP